MVSSPLIRTIPRRAGPGAEASEDEKVQQFLMKAVEQVNGGLARVQTIKKICILPADLSIEGGELTPTMKIKRKVIRAKYEAEIAGFYG